MGGIVGGYSSPEDKRPHNSFIFVGVIVVLLLCLRKGHQKERTDMNLQSEIKLALLRLERLESMDLRQFLETIGDIEDLLERLYLALGDIKVTSNE